LNSIRQQTFHLQICITFKPSGVRWLHFKMFRAILV